MIYYNIVVQVLSDWQLDKKYENETRLYTIEPNTPEAKNYSFSVTIEIKDPAAPENHVIQRTEHFKLSKAANKQTDFDERLKLIQNFLFRFTDEFYLSYLLKKL